MHPQLQHILAQETSTQLHLGEVRTERKNLEGHRQALSLQLTPVPRAAAGADSSSKLPRTLFPTFPKLTSQDQCHSQLLLPLFSLSTAGSYAGWRTHLGHGLLPAAQHLPP